MSPRAVGPGLGGRGGEHGSVSRVTVWTRAIVVAGGSLVAALIAFAIRRAFAGDVEDAIVDAVQILFTSVLIVGVLEWHERRRWRRADRQALRSLALMAHRAATGWSDAGGLARPTLRADDVGQSLRSEARELDDLASELDTLRGQLDDDGDADPVDRTVALLGLPAELVGYNAEGSRGRRLGYLEAIVRHDLDRLVARRLDPALAERAELLRDRVVAATNAADHADAVLRGRIVGSRPGNVPSGPVESPGSASLDPLETLALAVKSAGERARDAIGRLDDQARTLRRPLGALRNELRRVSEALVLVAEIVHLLRDEIDDAEVAAETRR